MANQVAAMIKSTKMGKSPPTNEYQFVFYEEQACFKIRKTNGLNLWLLPLSARTQVENILETYLKEVSSVSKSCSEKYTGIETITYSNIILLVTILSVILLNKKLLEDSILLAAVILGHIFISLTVTVVLCQYSKKTRSRRLSQISRKLEILTQNHNASSATEGVHTELKMDAAAQGNSMEFSLNIKVTSESSVTGPVSRADSPDSKGRSKLSTTVVANFQHGQSFSAAVGRLPSEQYLHQAEEQAFIQKTRSPLEEKQEYPKPTRPKNKMMTVGPGMRRIPKMTTIIQKRGFPNKSENQLREV